MAISVRMDELLEKELELTAKRRGITKSQFIIEAVERALGHKDPYRLLLQVREKLPADGDDAGSARYRSVPTSPLAATHDRVRDKLMAKHAAATADWLATRAEPPPAAPSARAAPARRPRASR